MFTEPAQVVAALTRCMDVYDPVSESLMALGGGGSDPHRDPFRAGFIDGFDERAEVTRRLSRLDERSRRLLVLWHVVGKPVAQIARELKVSRVHCYRIRKSALEAMIEAEPAVAVAS